MPYYVYGQDRPDAGPAMEKLTEAHWSYMDRFADRLILRGPTRSDDGAEHTGSVHVVDLPAQASAERFAAEEPFQQAGLFQRIIVAPALIVRHREPGRDLALVTGEWPPHDSPLGAELDDQVSFAAVLGADPSRSTGLVAVLSAPQLDQAATVIQALADQLAGQPVNLTAQRWKPGGRR
ncbi:MAG TPA: YciI family protein [Streptosporangiaceae bacterium]|jgi:hypothetical protein|nr:YciI family protein [Streptosporangiaceae bacterium]